MILRIISLQIYSYPSNLPNNTRFFNFLRCKHEVERVENVSICIDSVGRSEFLHFIVRSHHQKYIDFIRENIEEIYIK